MTVRPADPADLQFAIDIARRAGAITLDLFRSTSLRVDHKGDGSPVTAADLAAETFLRQQLIDTHPGDGIVGEEHGNTDTTTGRTWVVDPIDGTKAFTRGVPLFATLIALIDEHGPAIGVIHLPGLDETVAAGRGLGATVNGEQDQAFTSLDDGAANDLLRLCRAVAGQFLAALNGVNDIHAFAHRPKDGVVAVEPGRGHRGQEELGASSVASSIGHGENSRLVVLEAKSGWLTRDLPSRSTCSSSSRHWIL